MAERFEIEKVKMIVIYYRIFDRGNMAYLDIADLTKAQAEQVKKALDEATGGKNE